MKNSLQQCWFVLEYCFNITCKIKNLLSEVIQNRFELIKRLPTKKIELINKIILELEVIMNFGSTIYGLGQHGWTSLPWQACESYLHPWGEGQNYRYSHLNSSTIMVETTSEPTNGWLTALKITTYLLSFGIFPLIASIVKGCYRWAYKIEISRPGNNPQRLFYPKPIPKPQSAVPPPPVVSFAEIIDLVERGVLSLPLELDELIQCPILYEYYTNNKPGKTPVFLLQEGVSASSQLAVDWKNQHKTNLENYELETLKPDGKISKTIVHYRTLISRRPIKEFSYAPNVGLIKQVRLINNELCWVEPISGALLGEEGFKNPYFCEEDGYTYDLESFNNYIQQQINQQLEDSSLGPIKSPANPDVKFKGTIVLYPNKDFFKVVTHKNQEINQPTYTATTIELPLLH